MSLHFTLKVNGHSIYHAVDIVRMEPRGIPDDAAVCRYRVRAVRDDGQLPAAQFEAQFRHRYGDGALECVRKALNAIADECGGRIG